MPTNSDVQVRTPIQKAVHEISLKAGKIVKKVFFEYCNGVLELPPPMPGDKDYDEYMKSPTFGISVPPVNLYSERLLRSVANESEIRIHNRVREIKILRDYAINFKITYSAVENVACDFEVHCYSGDREVAQVTVRIESEQPTKE